MNKKRFKGSRIQEFKGENPSSLWMLSSTRQKDAEDDNILAEQINKLNIFRKLAKIDI
jgi:hypothetical protein